MTLGKAMTRERDSQQTAGIVRVESVIGSDLIVRGEIQSLGTLRVDGQVEGKITAGGSIIIGEKGTVKADITADYIIIGGTVKGDITAREKVELVSTGRLYGNVYTKPAKFVVSEGSIFDGGCTMSQGEGAKQPSEKAPERTKDEAPSKRPAAS
ncbi:MAG: polymer-forming cytoskeletal protein [Candidatus Abyssobacteria bacterium SURF_17]|uniref:Polymer-forming cytoskeletal protein n=1 Tax=Candidatus Abyssobacteria bacterium SURF_17 TaxID=2093361 RepID=A0A419ENE1_9BACT|nr:MAG: polymer-forming cytoskeletal protein [Candidatus Abyssubacteria bacterium SURF_17]